MSMVISFLYRRLIFPHQSHSENPLEETIYNVRKTYWGMSLEQVKKSEIWKLSRSESDTTLIYIGELLDSQCILSYGFEKEKLISVGYAFMSRNVSQNILLSMLKAKYGEPKKNASTNFLTASWITPDGKTSIGLYRALNGGLGPILIYTDKKREDEKYRKKGLQMLKQADDAF